MYWNDSMQNPSSAPDSRQASWLLAAAVLLCVAAPFLRGAAVLDDPFHYGEYFASAATLFAPAPPSFLPLTIHGALDFLPALLAEQLWGATTHFLPTYALYRGLDITAALLLVGLAHAALRPGNMHNGPAGRAPAVAGVLAVALMAPMMVGYRDLVLLACLALFLPLAEHPAARRPLLLVLFGALAGLGVFWSFDRGIAGAGALGLATLVLCRQDRRALLAPAAFALTTALVFAYSRSCSLASYLENLRVLASTASAWSYGWAPDALLLTALSLCVNGVAAASALPALWRSGRAPETVALALLMVAMLKVGTNRADPMHIYMAMWVPALVVLRALGLALPAPQLPGRDLLLVLLAAPALLLAGLLTVKFRQFGMLLALALPLAAVVARRPHGMPRPAAALLVVVLGLALAHWGYTAAQGGARGHYRWLGVLAAQPDNRAASAPGVGWAAAELARTGTACVFDLSNHGVINGLARLPTCTRFTYPVYAGPQHEAELIAALRAAAPPVVVYSASHWSYQIDGRAMPQRFPALDAFLLARYPAMRCQHGYCLRYLKDTHAR